MLYDIIDSLTKFMQDDMIEHAPIILRISMIDELLLNSPCMVQIRYKDCDDNKLVYQQYRYKIASHLINSNIDILSTDVLIVPYSPRYSKVYGYCDVKFTKGNEYVYTTTYKKGCL